MSGRVHYATNRDLTDDTQGKIDFGGDFIKGSPRLFRVGWADYDYNSSIDEVDILGTYLYDDQKKDGDKVRYGSGEMFEEVKSNMKENQRDLIVYIHGFSTPFKNSVINAAFIREKYGSGGDLSDVLVFSWPSDKASSFVLSEFFGYESDRDDARSSGTAIARCFERLIEYMSVLDGPDQCYQNIHLVAHSMGNWALRYALQRSKDVFGQRLPKIFRHMFLMAADADEDALSVEGKFLDLSQLTKYIYVYYAHNDGALRVSEKINPGRLGREGPDNLSSLKDSIYALDCHEVSETPEDKNNHGYFIQRKEVVDDVFATLNGVPQYGRDGTRARTHDNRRWVIKNRQST